jgi:hypothetical protein
MMLPVLLVRQQIVHIFLLVEPPPIAVAMFFGEGFLPAGQASSSSEDMDAVLIDAEELGGLSGGEVFSEITNHSYFSQAPSSQSSNPNKK